MSFGSKKTTTSADTTYAPTTTYTDESVNAGGDGSVALGSGASMQTSITMIDTSPEVAGAALSAARDVSVVALGANRDVALAGMETTGHVAGRAIDAAVDLYAIGSRERDDAMKRDSLLMQSQQGLVSRLSDLTSAALERSQTPDSQVTKQLLWVVGAVALAFLLLFSRTRR